MKHTFRILAAFFISLNASAQGPALTVPDFTFFKFNKAPFTKKDLEQNKTLFFVFFDAGCEHCQHAVQTLNTHYSDLKNATLYLISLDNQEIIKNFMNKYAKNLSGKKNVVLL